MLLIILILGVILYWSFKRYLNKRIHKTETETKYQYLNIFTQHHIFRKLFYLIPACFAYWAIDIFILPSRQTSFIIKAIKEIDELFILLIITLTANRIINACTQYSENLSALKGKPVKSYGQVIKLFIWFLFIILGLSVLLHKSPWGFLTGLGAVSALLMFIFKDSILGFVSSILITTDDIVRVGDWIEMPQFNINGTIIELSINTAKIQNFDNTYLTIPTSSIVTSYVKNWRGMYETGGRRIKRHLNIDVNTIQYCPPELLAKLAEIKALQPILKTQKDAADKQPNLLKTNLTNLTLFRAYLQAYLTESSDFRHDMDTFVRELQPSGDGLPVEIYVFTTSTNWGIYEEVQANLFDHIFAMLPLFELRAFQNETDGKLHVLHNPESTLTKKAS